MDKAAAKALYNEGLAAYNLDDYATAIEKFKACYRESGDPALLYNIAQSYRKARDPAQALSYYRKYLRNAPPLATNRPEAEARARQMEAQLSQSKPADSPSASPPVTPPADERAAEPAVEPRAGVPDAPTARPPAPDSPRQEPPATPRTTVVEPTPVNGAPPPAAPGATEKPRPAVRARQATPVLAWRRNAGLAMGVAAVGALGFGIGYQLLTEKRVGTFNSAGCSNTNNVVTGPSGCLALHDDENQARDFAIAGFLNAATLGTVAALLYFTSPGASPGREKAGVMTMVAGAASLAFGLTAQMVVQRHVSAFNEAGCNWHAGMITGPSGCASIEDKETTARRLSYGGYAGAALLGGAGAFLLFLGPKAQAPSEPSAGDVALLCAPAGPGAVGLSCAARF